MTFQGCYGLLTVPTPNLGDERKLGVSFKSGYGKSNTTFGLNSYSLSKTENWQALTYRLNRDFELTANFLRYSRKTAPVSDFNGSGFANGFGVKYTVPWQDLCFGFQWTPISANEIDKLDLFQLEHLRTIYVTATEDFRKNIFAFLNLKSCYTAKKEVEISSTEIQEIGQKNFLIGTLGLEYKESPKFSWICELECYNYRELLVKHPNSCAFNLGYRRTNKDFQLELSGLDLLSNPRAVLGFNWSWN
ncbi:MAG: hypothetical protein HQM08_14665 [Candidatus Riflebacteria bacterium]|nr:hypothetical protein [Candidatus Riflebacteria bacterium]